MRQPRTYVVRVYRQGARNLAGVVEDARTGEQRSFSSMQELWSSLRLPFSGRTRPPAKNRPA